MKFKVIDNKTGKEADIWEIALHEEWAQSLIYCDIEGFAITEDGRLIVIDECGYFVYCDYDPERFKVVFEEERPHGEWIPVSERLPNMDNGDSYDVLCCDIYENMMIGHPFKDDESESGYSAEEENCFMYDCVAWMPLPEPFEKEGDEE